MPRRAESLSCLKKPKSSHRLRLLLPAERIRPRVEELAEEIRRDYRDRNPLFVCVLKGAFVFAADLIRAAGIHGEMDFVHLRSYHSGAETSGGVELVADCASRIEGRDVIVVEDIVDTGITTRFLLDHLIERGAANVKVCALLDKPSRRLTEIRLDYAGFVIPNVFVVGYGLDFAEDYRHLPDVYALVSEEGNEQADE